MSDIDTARGYRDLVAQDVVNARDYMNFARDAYYAALNFYQEERCRLIEADRALYDAIGAHRGS